MTTETKQAPETELLTDQQIAEIAFAQAERLKSAEAFGVPVPAFWHDIDALIATVKQLRAREAQYARVLHDRLREMNALIASFEKVEEERDDLSNAISKIWEVLGITEYTGKHISEHVADLQSQLEQLRAENERLKNRDVVCWHCGSVLLAPSKPRCEDCPTECDVVNCDAYGCTERLVSQHLDSWK